MIDPMDQFWDLVRTQAQIANQDLEDRLAKFLVTVPVDQWYRVRMDHYTQQYSKQNLNYGKRRQQHSTQKRPRRKGELPAKPSR